ncbi:hypothetical protein DXT89_01700 [Agrobacterium vitis]|uniref:Uncharacterized protein n=1 Tax=Agrobacterium vitis TaxID=373 RepID=A0A368NYN1_AGRVI|nr:hypothetical protein DXM22_02025 [Agrobacterium vitis]KAA3532097.1 hypothetical protein DXT89_01700 [Agrobacterium vitis]RCU55220.1 hypothetical protein ASB66_009845 [Agrobacterium vitis]
MSVYAPVGAIIVCGHAGTVRVQNRNMLYLLHNLFRLPAARPSHRHVALLLDALPESAAEGQLDKQSVINAQNGQWFRPDFALLAPLWCEWRGLRVVSIWVR